LRILIADDDREIVAALSVYLKNEGYEVLCAYDGEAALSLLKEAEVHLILLDVMMPKKDGIEVLFELRRSQNTPVIMLSAKGEDEDKIKGLDMGADDYLTKPFNPLELIARVKSQLRRYTTLGAVKAAEGVFRSGGLTLDEARREVTVEGEPVRLTPVEFGILALLIREAGRVFSIGQIYERVWNEPAINPENTVAVHIRRIREKIEIDPKEPKYLKVVWGIGYKIEKYDPK